MQDVSARLTRQFAECLQKNMGAEQAARAPASAAGGGSSPAPAPAVQTTSKPIQGIRLAWFALKAAIVRGFKRLFGRRH
jgi:hypothetical protein